MKANAETSVKTNVPAVQAAAAIPDPFDLDGWVVEVDERTGALADYTTSLDERIAELEEFAVLIFEHARLTHSHLADLHRALRKASRSGDKRSK
jgi:hypothetical protein